MVLYSPYSFGTLCPGTCTVTVTIHKEQCPQTWLHANYFGDSILFGMVTVTASVSRYRVLTKEYGDCDITFGPEWIHKKMTRRTPMSIL